MHVLKWSTLVENYAKTTADLVWQLEHWQSASSSEIHDSSPNRSRALSIMAPPTRLANNAQMQVNPFGVLQLIQSQRLTNDVFLHDGHSHSNSSHFL